MITFSKLGDYGRLGNSLFQVAATIGLANRNNSDYGIKKWQYSYLFDYDFNEYDLFSEPDHTYNEPQFIYDPTDFEGWEDRFRNNTVDLLGYFQNEKYFPSNIREIFKIKQEHIDRVKEKYTKLFSKPTIAIGVRRGDYVGNPGYYQLPARYYIQALQKLDYKNCNLIFISDDINWCWFHFKAFPNAYFPKGDEVDHFILGMLTDYSITSNSTFHWWSAYLGNASTVLQPSHLFAGHLLDKNWNVNFYIENDRFKIYNHEKEKIDLSDVTITIPVKYDHPHRKRNLELTVGFLKENFDVNIIIGEQMIDDKREFETFAQNDTYLCWPDGPFHRTRMLNQMAKEAETPIIVNYDCDILLAPAALLVATEHLRNGTCDFVYPYEYTIMDVKASLYKGDPAVYAPEIHDRWTYVRPTLGGIVLIKKDIFVFSGGENENFISYGPEDVERYERWLKLGFGHRRVRGHIYHLMHWRGPDSGTTHKHYDDGVKELKRVREMNLEELSTYVATWNNFT